jgi:hypothetical protein
LTARPYGPRTHRYITRTLLGVLAVLALSACGNPTIVQGGHEPPGLTVAPAGG